MWISGKRQITAKICVCDRQKRISGSRKRQRTSRLSMSPSQRFCDKYNRLFSLLNHFIQIFNWSITTALLAIIFSNITLSRGLQAAVALGRVDLSDFYDATFSKLIYCGQHFPGWYIADNIFQDDILRTIFFQVDILRAILLKGNHLREEEMCVDGATPKKKEPTSSDVWNLEIHGKSMGNSWA